MSIFLPDVNVLVALTLRRHIHSKTASEWYEREDRPSLQICRLTQLSFLRLLTSQAIVGDEILTNEAAWDLYAQLLTRGNAVFCDEPNGLDRALGNLASFGKSAPKLWADAYLASFASTSRLRLVTFDRALARLAQGSVLLTE